LTVCDLARRLHRSNVTDECFRTLFDQGRIDLSMLRVIVAFACYQQEWY